MRAVTLLCVLALVCAWVSVPAKAQSQSALNPPSGPRYVTPVSINIESQCQPQRKSSCCRSAADSCCNKAVTPCYVEPEYKTEECTLRKTTPVCCRSATDSCCNKAVAPCYVEPEYKPEECARRKESVCCKASTDSCCNPCLGSNARFAEAEAQATTEVQAQATAEAELEVEYQGECTDVVKASRCCRSSSSPCCSNPCDNPPRHNGNTTLGSMKMGQLKVENTTCTNGCGRKTYTKAEMVTNTDSDGAKILKPNTVSAQSGANWRFAEVDAAAAAQAETAAQAEAEAQAQAEAEAEAEAEATAEADLPIEYMAPYTDPVTGKLMKPAKIAGCSPRKRSLRCCSTDVEHYTTCCRPKLICRRRFRHYISYPRVSTVNTADYQGSQLGSMTLGTLRPNACNTVQAQEVCCRSKQDTCCNFKKAGCPSF